MPIFRYEARDEKGRAIEGKTEAPSTEALADKLSKLGYAITSISRPVAPYNIDHFFASLSRVSLNDLVMYTVQLAGMLAAGLSLPNSLYILIEQVENPKLKEVCQEIYNDIKGGQSYSQALQKHTAIFPPLYINTVRAGEMSGNLEEILRRLSTYLEKESELKQKIVTALFYPVILVVFGVGVILLIVMTILPAFTKIFLDAGVALPLPTQILYNTNLFLKAYWKHLIAGIAALAFAFNYYRKTENGRYLWDRFIFSLPIWGDLVKKVTVSRFCRTLSTLIGSGVSIIEALENVEAAIDNSVLSKVIKHVRSSVSKGENLSVPLKDSKEFPALAVQMIAVGEESGNLESMLNKIGDFYDMATDYSLKRLTALIEPFFLVIIGGMVAFIFASILLPIFRMVSTLKH